MAAVSPNGEKLTRHGVAQLIRLPCASFPFRAPDKCSARDLTRRAPSLPPLDKPVRIGREAVSQGQTCSNPGNPSTSSRNASPRTSKLRYWSKEAQAGDSSTTGSATSAAAASLKDLAPAEGFAEGFPLTGIGHFRIGFRVNYRFRRARSERNIFASNTPSGT